MNDSTRARLCSHATCDQQANFTMNSSYEDRVAAIGPLSPEPDPWATDLCARHAARFTAPQGWQVLRYDEDAVIDLDTEN